ncbi:MAG: rod shape-determining protein MreD [Acidobacteriota bacterium]
MRQLLRTAAVLFLAVLFQVAVGRFVAPPHVLPLDVFLVITVYYAGAVSQLRGTLVGAIAGILADALSVQRQGLGRQGIALAVAGYAAGALNSLFVITAGLMKVISVFAATLVASGALALVDLVMEGSVKVQAGPVFWEAAINAFASPLAFWLLDLWHHGKDRSARGR